MASIEKARAIGLIARANVQSVADMGDADAVISVMDWFPSWEQREYAVGFTILWDGQPMTCREAHSTITHPDWTPVTYRAAWKPWHARRPEQALPFVKPLHAEERYLQGEYCLDEQGRVRECVPENGTDFSPEEWPQGWKIVEVKIDG